MVGVECYFVNQQMRGIAPTAMFECGYKKEQVQKQTGHRGDSVNIYNKESTDFKNQKTYDIFKPLETGKTWQEEKKITTERQTHERQKHELCPQHP